jgi:hypothetical protein
MLRLEWNALRPGDRVAVHDDATAGFPLLDGVVAVVQPTRGANDVAVRIDRGGPISTVVRPRRLAVHIAPIEPMRSCWRCDVTARPVLARTDGR